MSSKSKQLNKSKKGDNIMVVNADFVVIAIAALAVAIVVVGFKLTPYLKAGADKLSTLEILNLSGEIYLEVQKLFDDFNSIDVVKYKSDKDYRIAIINKAMDKVYDILKERGYDLEKEAPIIAMLGTRAVEQLVDSITISAQSKKIEELESPAHDEDDGK